MNYKLLCKIIALILMLCLFLCGCVDVSDTEQSAVPAMTYDTVSTENIVLPCDSYYCDGKRYGEIVALFENAGFTNVKAIAQNGDATKETRVNGSVIAVSVNNNIIFSQGALYTPDTEINIYYVVSHITESTASTQSTVSQSTSSQQAVESTPAQIMESTQENAISPTEEPTFETSSETVWITENGKKYHSKSTCSGMKTPKEISKQEAEEQGYEPCKRCCG